MIGGPTAEDAASFPGAAVPLTAPLPVPMRDTAVLDTTAKAAQRLYADLDHVHVAARAGYEELKSRFDLPLPDDGVDAVRVLEELLENARDGLVGSGGPRFVGWVLGGSLPSAIAADWLVSTWDRSYPNTQRRAA